MFGNSLDKLVSIAGPALGPDYDSHQSDNSDIPIEATNVSVLLRKRNGFFAFEGALHVFPINSKDKDRVGYELLMWNKYSTWKQSYGSLAKDFYFAEDIFGCQWFLRGTTVWSFDPETADSKYIADSMEQWAKILLKNYEMMTGWPLAHEWQSQNRVLRPYERLMPRQPFVCNGKFDVVNMQAIDAIAGMVGRSAFAIQVNSLPDGSWIKLENNL